MTGHHEAGKTADAVVGPRRRLSAVMMADVSGSTHLIQSDEHQARAAITECWALVRLHAEAVEGRIVDNVGDSILIDFPSVRCALAAARASLHALSEKVPQVRLKTGIHVGDLLVDDGGFFGEAINLTARLQSLAGPDEILVSRAVVELAGVREDFHFRYLGRPRLKNIVRPIEVYLLEDQPRAAGPSRLRGLSARRPSPTTLVLILSMLAVVLSLVVGLHIHDMVSDLAGAAPAAAR